MTIYIDEVFAVNLLMDGFMLWAVGKLLQRKIVPWRLMLAAVLGALYGAAVVLPGGAWLAKGTVKSICALFMALIGFGWVSWNAYVKVVIYLYLVSFAMGGSTIALMYYFGERIVQTWSGIALVQVDFSIFWLFGGALVTVLMVHLLRNSLQKKLEQTLQIVPVTMQLRGKCVHARLLVDSGNCLTDTAGGMPVIIVQSQYVQRLFSDYELVQMEAAAADAILHLPELSGRLRLLPYQTVGYRGLMLGVRLDGLQIGTKQPIPDVVLALSPQQFAADGAYQGVISPALL